MKRGHAQKQESPRERARLALDHLSHGIGWNHIFGSADGDEIVRLGLDAMASALIDWRDLGLTVAPLDAVLAELGADDELVEITAQLIRVLGQAAYFGGLTEARVRKAEGLREDIMYTLKELVNRLEEQDDGSDA